MASLKQTREPAYGSATPACPNCHGSMTDATVTLGQIVMGWPLPEPEALRPDGYADQVMPETNGGPIATCDQCGQQSLLSVGCDGLMISLTLLRTDADRRFLGEDLRERKP